MAKFIDNYKSFFNDRKAISLTFAALFLLAISLIANLYAGRYASLRESNAVTDIILSNIRAFDVDSIFVYGTFIAFLGLLIYLIRKPFQIPYVIKSIALFVVVRSIFIMLTHIGPYPVIADLNPNMPLMYLFSHFSFTGDLFFSGHAGLPFLLALIFRKKAIYRYILLVVSLFFSVIVLLGHLHYSIDVLSAFFIAYGIFHMSQVFFPQDKAYFDASFSE